MPSLVGDGKMAEKSRAMKSPVHATFSHDACPLLPEATQPQGPAVTRELGVAKCVRFYFAALTYAQSLWREGKPAQAVLQLNKSFMADLRGDEEVLQVHPPPYAVLVWILRHRPDECFLGNPVRHFQHLATRMNGERKEIRSWRAWACFHLSRQVLPMDEFPIDAEQVAEEGVVFPEWQDVVAGIREAGWTGEVEVLEDVMRGLE
ncbi:hypothetical protein OKA04_00315 [Luteolibacter flavescens]|uniref:Uncharacterized protein n=1 Tax=Luteolibacter flavescens TaxID=1859460 RepID=A0ABT3FJH9_9BACT|nr:hypothetical protein [Luteolibacter flavescens]MCW1883150.1 hypothetical protein [Luteolibacter flavescens]